MPEQGDQVDRSIVLVGKFAALRSNRQPAHQNHADQHVQAANRAGVALKDYMAARAKDIPLGRIGRAEEFANMACFLVSDLGSYITGTAINIDGGRSPVV